MAGKEEVERKVIGKKHRKLSPRKLDTKKNMEEVKFLGGLVAEMTAVQAELTKELDDGLLRSERNHTKGNLLSLQITTHQLRQVNNLGAQLNAVVQNYLDDLLDVLDLAREDKVH